VNFEALYGEALNLELNSNDSNTLFTTARRKQAINDAQQEFCDLTECLIRQSSITVSCNTAEYALLSSGTLGGSTDYARLAAQGVEYRVLSSGSSASYVTYLTGDQFPQRSIVWRNKETPGWRQSTSPSTPTGYYLRPDGGTVYLGLDRPPVVGSSQHAELIVPYVAIPAAMTSTGDLPFTVAGSARYDLTPYHRALPHYAAYKLLPLLGDEQGSQTQLQKFQGYVARFLQALRPKGGTSVVLGTNYLAMARRPRGSRLDRLSRVPPSQWDRS
jgi:hypothetical protein